MEWQPIETAPKDATPILICDAFDFSAVSLGYWSDNGDGYPWRFVDFNGGGAYTNGWMDGKHGPTHWMPLPKKPEARK